MFCMEDFVYICSRIWKGQLLSSELRFFRTEKAFLEYANAELQNNTKQGDFRSWRVFRQKSAEVILHNELLNMINESCYKNR